MSPSAIDAAAASHYRRLNFNYYHYLPNSMANDIYYLDFGYTISETNQYLVPAGRDDERRTTK